MTVNPFLLYNDQVTEQDLMNDLVVEAIQAYGEDVRYIPRHLVNYDQLFGADDSSRFNTAYTIEMRMESVLGFGGDKDFYSQFGHQIRDEIVYSVARDRFLKEIGLYEDQPTPNEGDLIWSSRLNKLFVIKYTDPREMFYQLGRVYTWQLTCEVFEYSGEGIDTGDDEIDAITQLSTNVLDWALTDESGNVLTDESGNVLTVDQFVLEDVSPDSENDFLPPELLTDTNFDVTVQDPFGFLAGQ